MTTVKICGIRTVEAARACATAQADYVGFNFVPQSRRVVSPEQARSLACLLGESRPVALFMDAPLEHILDTMDDLDFSHVQLHGSEPPAMTARLRDEGLIVIKAIGVGDDFEPSQLDAYEGTVDYLLLDAKAPGSGQRIDNPRLKSVTQPYWLAGGLTPDNVASAIANPFVVGVDTASGVEVTGQSNPDRIKEFCRAAFAAATPSASGPVSEHCDA